MSVWFPFEVLLGYYVRDSLAWVVLPIIVLLWTLETRWLWSEADFRQNQAAILMQLGRYTIILLSISFELENLSSAFGLCEETVEWLLLLGGALQPGYLPLRLASLFCQCLSIWLRCGIFPFRTFLVGCWLCLQPVGLFQSEDVNQRNSGDAIKQADALLSSVPEKIKKRNTPGSQKAVEDGQLLVEVMAPQIVLNMLSDSEEFFSALSEGNGTFRWISNAFVKAYGYEKHELLGKNGWASIHPDDVARLLKTPRDRDSGDRVHMTYRRRRKDGSYLLVDNFGIFSEGFYFFQERPRKGEQPANHFEVEEESLAQAWARTIQEELTSGQAISEDFIDLLRDYQSDLKDATPKPPDQRRASEVINETIQMCTRLKTTISKESGKERFLKVILVDYPSEMGQRDTSLLNDGPRFSRTIVNLLRGYFKVGNTKVTLAVIGTSWALGTLSIRFSTEHNLANSSIEFRQAKSFIEIRCRGAISQITSEQGCILTIVAPLLSANEDICILVDDDEVILRILERKLKDKWKRQRGSPLIVLKAKTSQDAFRQIAQLNPNARLSFASVDLNLGENSDLSGTETAQTIRDTGVAKHVFIMTSSEEYISGDFKVLSKGSATIVDTLCEMSA